MYINCIFMLFLAFCLQYYIIFSKYCISIGFFQAPSHGYNNLRVVQVEQVLHNLQSLQYSTVKA